MKNEKASILILTLWTLAFLSIFAVLIGFHVRQRIDLLIRLEDRSRLRFVVEAGVKKAIVALKKDLQINGAKYSTYGKISRHNNNELFRHIRIGQEMCNVSYPFYEGNPTTSVTRYGFIDEESKININTANRIVLERLFQHVLSTQKDEARDMADAIIEWREFGKTQLEGFYSSDYYANLQYPYEAKSAVFEIIDELALVKGFNNDLSNRLKPFITIYGDGKININTATKTVLIALGLEGYVADKVLLVRRGYDGIEATVDDYIFRKIFDITSEVKSFIELKEEEMRQIDQLNTSGQIKANSFYYGIQSHAQLEGKNNRLSAVCIYNTKENRIEYWQEK